MEITTHDPEIVDVRRTVIELILSNHPNDCLKCARNYECELQRLTAEFGIKEAPFPRFLRDTPVDRSTKAVDLDPVKCILCGRCVHVCQNNQNVWALSFLERGFRTRISPAGDIQLADSPCIRCGQCSAHCPTGALVEAGPYGQGLAGASGPGQILRRSDRSGSTGFHWRSLRSHGEKLYQETLCSFKKNGI